MEDNKKNSLQFESTFGSGSQTATEDSTELNGGLLNRPIRSDLLQIKPISFESRTVKQIKENQERQATLIPFDSLNQNSGQKKLIILGLAVLLSGIIAFFSWKAVSNSNKQSNKQAAVAQTEDLAENSDDVTTESTTNTDSSKDSEDTKETLDKDSTYKTGWTAAYEPLDILTTNEDRSLVLIPYTLKNASKSERCFGSNPRICLPKNLLKSSQAYCLKTRFSDSPSGVEISEITGYSDEDLENEDNSKAKTTLVFDKFTASRHKFRKRNTSKDIEWKLVSCPN
jgi:hypothetical protein